MRTNRKRSRRTRRNHISTWPLAIAAIVALVIWTHPFVGLVIALVLAGAVLGAVIGAATYLVSLKRGTVKPPARITRDRKNRRWSVEFF